MPTMFTQEWQVNCRVWHLPWHNYKFDEQYQVWVHFAGIGPIQFHWYSPSPRLLA